MKIIVGKFPGFCIGVRKAILKISDELKNKNETLIYGEIIHNPQTISVLSERGLKQIDNLKNIANKNVAVRTHGIPFTELKQINQKASKTINLTCSKVSKVQGIIKKYANQGYFTIIVGDKNHAEVESLKSYASNGHQIVSNYDEIRTVKKRDKMILVSQTTLDESLFNKIEKYLKNKKYKIKIFNTICNSTHNRQNELINFIRKGITKSVVIGGKNSGNTKRLAEIGRKNNVTTFHVEKGSELEKSMFSNDDIVFVTAGASTPSWIINNVINRLNYIKFINKNNFIRLCFLFNYFLNKSRLYYTIFAVLLTYLISKSFGYQINMVFYLLIFILTINVNLISIFSDNSNLR